MDYFKGRRVLVTGGSSGIGLATAQRLADNGAAVVLLARDPDKLVQAAAEVSSHGEVETVSCDLGDLPAVARAAAAMGRVDMLINNAGITRPGNFLELPEETFEEMMRVNYLGGVHLTRMLLPQMLERGQGHVAFVSSLLGLLGIWGYSAYAASKFAVRGFAECLRCELKPHNVKVSVCYPPDTDTPQHQGEQEFLPPQTRAIAGNGGLLEADYVAQKLLQGMAAHRFDIVPGFSATLVARANQWLPGVVRTFIDRDAAKADNSG